MSEEQKQKTALFRFGVISGILTIRGADDRGLEKRIREAADQEWDIPGSDRSSIARSTIRDWLKRYKDSGGDIESLKPQKRVDQGKARCMDTETEAALINLKKTLGEVSLPVLMREARSRQILPPDFRASQQSIYRLFQRHGLDDVVSPRPDMRRFEAELPNDLWQADCLHGPMVIVDGKLRKAFGFVFIDDHSRLIPHGEFYLRENIEYFKDTLRKALNKRGLPRKLYVDNGPYFRSHQLHYSCASLGIALIHCTAYRPEGKGKIERFNKTIRQQFLSTVPEGMSLPELNRRFLRWIDDEYHLKAHSSTGQKPLERYLKHLHLIRSTPKNLDDFFRIKTERSVDKDRTVSLLGKVFEAPVELIGRKIALLYHPNDPLRIEAMFSGKSFGWLVPLNPYINCTIRRRQKITEIIPAVGNIDSTITAYAGGRLFDGNKGDH